ncbi:MAG: hypothetical protein II201_02345, partial [Clostridia bacterium]|nr:hypothetical protein [Clostridia bacterium]
MFRRKRAISFLLVLALLIGTLLLPGVSAVAEDSIDKLSEDILALEAVTLDSYDAVYSMIDRYNALGNTGLSSDAVNHLSKLKDRVDYLKENGLYYYDDFESFQPEGKTYGWWECINSDTVVDDFKVVAAKEKLKTEDFQSYVKNETNTEGVILSGKTNHCLAISALPSTSDKTLTDHKLGSRIPKQIMALPDSIVNGKGILKASFKYYWPAQYTEYSLILSRQDNLHYSGIKLASKDFGISKITCNIDADKFCTEETLISKSDLKGYYYATWVDVTLEYITKEDGNYYRVTFLSPKTISNTANTENLTDVVEIKVGAPVSNLYFTGNNVVSSYKYNKLPINHRGIDDVKIYNCEETDYLVNQISLLPDIDNLTVDNYSLCMSLYQHYLKLSDNDKKKITNIDKLLSAKQQVEKLYIKIPDDLLYGKPIDFEDKSDIRYISGNINVTNNDWGIIDNPRSDSINSSDSVLHIIPNIRTDNVGVYLLNENFVSGSTPLKY